MKWQLDADGRVCVPATGVVAVLLVLILELVQLAVQLRGVDQALAVAQINAHRLSDLSSKLSHITPSPDR